METQRHEVTALPGCRFKYLNADCDIDGLVIVRLSMLISCSQYKYPESTHAFLAMSALGPGFVKT